MKCTNKPLMYDVYCGAGGATKGYQRAGFYVIGVDINKQPRYCGDEFIHMNAFEFFEKLLSGTYREPFAIHASPPCQIHSTMTKGIWKDRLDSHLNLIPQTRAALIELGKPYVIENVAGAKNELINPLMLCGTMFNLRASNNAQLRRHRYFESCPVIWFAPATCQHERQPAIGVYGGGQHPLMKKRVRKNATIGVYGSTGGQSSRDGKSFYGIDDRRLAMGIDWMSGKELNQAIPPAYTEFIGNQLLKALQ